MIGKHDRGNEPRVDSQGEGLTILHTQNRQWTQQAIWTAAVQHHQVLVRACNLAMRWELKVKNIAKDTTDPGVDCFN